MQPDDWVEALDDREFDDLPPLMDVSDEEEEDDDDDEGDEEGDADAEDDDDGDDANDNADADDNADLHNLQNAARAGSPAGERASVPRGDNDGRMHGGIHREYHRTLTGQASFETAFCSF